MKYQPILKLKNSENFFVNIYKTLTFRKVEIKICNYSPDGQPLYMVNCEPDTFDYLDSSTSYSLESLKGRIRYCLGADKNNKLKWEKVK